MLNRSISFTTIIIGILCCVFVLVGGVEAASRQASNVSTSVQFQPGLLLKVEAIINDGEGEVIFDNYSTSPLNHSHFAPVYANLDHLTQNDKIKFRITNFTTDKDVFAQVYIDNSKSTAVYAEPLDAGVTTIKTNRIEKSGGTGTTNEFYLVSLYNNNKTHIIIDVSETTDIAGGGTRTLNIFSPATNNI